MKYREANQTDAKQIAAIHAQSWRDTYRGLFSDDFLDNEVFDNRYLVWEERLINPDNKQLVIVTETQNKIVGFVCCYADDDEQYGSLIDNLHIVQEYKHKGIGTQLMLKVATWLKVYYPNSGVYLWVMEANQPARIFYEKLGAKNADVVDKPNPVGGGSAKNCRYVWDSPVDMLHFK